MRAEAVALTTRVLIIDDDADFRRTTARILARHGYWCVEAADGVEALLVLDVEDGITVALCDVRMPGASGIDLLAELCARFPEVVVVMTTALDDPRVAEEAFDLGALGYVTKPFETNDLLINLASALRRRRLDHAHRTEVHDLEALVANGVASTLTARTDDQPLVRAVASGCSGFVNTPLLGQLRPAPRGVGADLTPREVEVLELMARGLLNKQVARHLGLQLNTVRNHSQSILAKLQAHSRLEAVATAVRDGVIDYPSRAVEI